MNRPDKREVCGAEFLGEFLPETSILIF